MRLIFPEAPIPRSTLAPLEPMGLGTALAESVESYVLRLAKEHRVTRYHIESLVSNAGSERLYCGTSRQPFRIDSPIHKAKEFVRRLASLTQVSAVESLGLGWLAGKIASTGALRNHRAWCPQCVGRFQASGSSAYLPLAWSLPSYQICTEHGGAIHSSCFTCGKGIDVRREWAHPFTHCPHCTCSLARSESAPGNSLRDRVRREVHRVDQSAARYLGELIAVASEMRATSMLDYPDVSKLVASAIGRDRATDHANLAALAGISKSTLHGIAVTRASRPSLDILARLSVAADVSLAGTLFPSLWKVDSYANRTQTALPPSPRRARHRLSWCQIRSEANSQMRLTRPESPYALALRLQVDLTHMKKRLPKTVEKLADRHKKGVAAEREAVQAKLAVRMREYIVNQPASISRISIRALAKELGVDRSCLDFRAAWARCQAMLV